MVTSRMSDQIGRVLGGRYRLVAPIGAGGSAWVYLADDVQLRRRVAVKVLHDALAEDDAFLRRFRAEAQAAAALNHPHIMSVYDSGSDGGPYVVLEYLAGGSLRGVLDRAGSLTPSQALQVGLETARALDFAHRRGVVHRDIKPANLLFDAEGRLRVADFGLARALAEAAWTEPEGVMVGTARYASPEQAQGRAVDGSADVYALGLVLIEAVAGEVPFAADTTIATLMARVERDVPVPPVMGRLAPIVASACSRDPDQRPSAAELGQALYDEASHLPRPKPLSLSEPASDPVTVVDLDPTVHPGTPATDTGEVDEAEPPPTKRRRTRRWPLVLAVLLLLGAMGAAGWFVYQQFAIPSHEVPELVSLTEADAVAQVEGFGWDVEVQRRYQDGTEAGLVVDTEPRVGDSLQEGRRLVIVVSRGPTPVALPALEGLTEAEATEALAQAGLEVGDVARQHHEEVEAGRVLDWLYDGTSRPLQVPAGHAVDLVLSDGPAPRSVPNVAGLSLEDATAALEAAGLVVSDTEVFSDDVDKGLVVGTDPAVGTEVERGTEVTVKVSKGADLVTVPDVKGKSLDDATKALEKAGLVVSEIEGNPNHKVLVTDPDAGEKVKRGSSVVVIMRRV